MLVRNQATVMCGSYGLAENPVDFLIVQGRWICLSCCELMQVR